MSAEALAFLAARGEQIEIENNELIVRRGEPGHAFYVVLEGEVEVRLRGADGASLPLARLGEGATFGEMALIRNEPVSADVAAVGRARLLACDESAFRTALADCDEFRFDLLTRLAGDLQRTTSEAWDFFQKAEALRLLIRCETGADAVIARSAPMRKTLRAVESAANQHTPCLITGERGTGKLLMARTLHEASRGPSAPLIIVDCQRLRSSDAQRLLLGPPGTSKAANALHGLGAYHLARGGSLILRNADSLAAGLQQEISEIAGRRGPGDARLIATVCTSSGAGTGEALLSEPLACLTAACTVHVPPMRSRRKDIIPLAQYILAEVRDGNQYLGTSAEHALVTMDYQQGNATQLRETVEFAARCSDGEIRSEHIFSGIETGEHAPGVDLGPLRVLQLLLRRHSLTIFRGFVLVSFVASIALCLFAPHSTPGRLANGFVWSVWEPVVFALFLLLGSVWCTVCPLSTAGRLTRRLASLERPPPERLKRWSVGLMIAGFFAIIWFEHVFHMITNPAATGAMLLGLILASVVFCMLYTREVWCRHVCPLGALAKSLAPAAPLEIGARPGVCTSSCSSHSCYKGDGEVPGCTVFHHPLNAAESHHCKLCLDCLKSCPNDSAKLFLRPPIAGIWKLGSTSGAIAPFATAVFFLAPVFLAAQTTRRGFSAFELLALGAVACLLGILLSKHLSSLLIRHSSSPEEPPDTGVGVQVAFSLVILGWGPLMAYQLGNIPALKGLVLESARGAIWEMAPIPPPWTVMASMQTLVVLLAATLTVVALSRVRALALDRGLVLSDAGWVALWVLCVAYLSTTVLLLW